MLLQTIVFDLDSHLPTEKGTFHDVDFSYIGFIPENCSRDLKF